MLASWREDPPGKIPDADLEHAIDGDGIEPVKISSKRMIFQFVTLNPPIDPSPQTKKSPTF